MLVVLTMLACATDPTPETTVSEPVDSDDTDTAVSVIDSASDTATTDSSTTPTGTTGTTAVTGDTGVPLVETELVTSPVSTVCNYSAVPPAIAGTSDGSGRVQVTHSRFANDCWEATETLVRATLKPVDGTIELEYGFNRIVADCTWCDMDAEYGIDAVPAGTWTLTDGATSVEVVVP